MKKNFIVMVALIILTGCSNFSQNLLQIPHVKHPSSIILGYNGDPVLLKDSRNLIKEKVSEYLITHPDLNPSVKDDLDNFIFRKGMNKDQVRLLIDEPNSKNVFAQNREVWIYAGKREGYLHWYGESGNLTFEGGVLTDIEIRYTYDY